MLVNQLVVLPTESTLDYFSKVLGGCPFNIDLTLMHVVINSSESPMAPNTDLIYTARAGTLGVFYDSATGESSLILPLDSHALQARRAELQSVAPDAFGQGIYYPHLVLVRGMPPLARSYRSFIASVGNTLAAGSDGPLLFDAETSMSKELRYVPDADFYATMRANDHRRQIFA